MNKLIELPNVRKLFIPDTGYIMFDADLAGADAQVVAWEAEDEDLKNAFRKGLDVHSKNAEDMWGTSFTKLQGNEKAKKRKQNKVAVHLTNYGGAARTLAITQNWTVHEADQFQKRWFSLHPNIKEKFHGKVQLALDTNRVVRNPFGYQRVFFDRPDACFPEALAWIPQSTVARTTFRGAIQLEKRCPWIDMLLQVHDSLVFQAPSKQATFLRDDIRIGLSITIPYEDPLTIPWGIKSSAVSWGDCT